VHTLTTTQVGSLLHQWAAGSYSDEAAVQLLVAHHTWLERSDFKAACLNYDHDGDRPVAWVDWDSVAGFLDDAGCSSSEARILRLVAELAGVDSGWPLGGLLSGLDDHNSRRVADAFAHALRLDGRR
jgi:hypothetical protein